MRLEDDASRSIMQLPSPASQKIPKKTVAVAVLAVAGLVGAWERGGLREKFIGSVMAADGRPERNAMAQFDVSAAMEDFEVERVLGTGMVGSVSLASCPGFGCGKEFALKKIKEVSGDMYVPYLVFSLLSSLYQQNMPYRRVGGYDRAGANEL